MSTSEIDEFVDAFLDRVTADGDVKKAGAAIQLFLDDVRGMKKQALASPSLFGSKPPAIPSPNASFASPLPSPSAPPPPLAPTVTAPAPPTTPPSVFSPGWLGRATVPGRTAAPVAVSSPGRALVPAPGGESYFQQAAASFDKNPLSTWQNAVDYAQSTGLSREDARALFTRRVGGRPLAPKDFEDPNSPAFQDIRTDIARYANSAATSANSEAQKRRQLEEKNLFVQRRLAADRASAAEGDRLAQLALRRQQEADAALAGQRQAASSEVRGRWQGMVNKYMGDVRQRVQQQNAASDVAGKAKTFLRGLPAAAVRGLTTAGRPDQAAFESRTVNAAKIKELEGALSERATNYDKQEAAQTTAFDSRVNDEAAAVRARLAALNKRIDTGPIPAFKNIPQLTPVNNVGEQDLAEREKLQSDLAALGKLRIRKEAPAGVPGLAEQRTQLLASQARNRARTQAQTTMPSSVRAPVAPSAPAVPARPAAQPVLASAQPSYSIRPGGDGIIKLQSARILKKASFGSAVGEAGTKAYDWTAGKLAGGLDSVSNFAKSNPGTYGAGLGALVGAGWTALSPRRKDGSKPWLRNLLIGGALGGALTGGLSYLSKMAPKPATTNLNPPQVK